jgi:Prokaryotic phospholipase A2
MGREFASPSMLGLQTARRRGVRSCAIAVLLAGALGASATPALAHTTQTPAVVSNMSAHPWSSDGCSKSPDQPFLHACIHHDGCYALKWASRATCDSWFLNDMRATCAEIRGGSVCTGAAWTYYLFVRAFGRN